MSPIEKVQIDAMHAEMVAALAKPGDQIVRDLTPFMAHCWHMASCIQGEAGELFDAIKKPAIYAKGEVDRANVVEEFGDLEFYMEGLRQKLGITREETLLANREKLLTGAKARYKTGTYSNEQAQARADKQESKMPVHHVSNAEAGVMFSRNVPTKSAEGTSPMEQPGALSPEGASSPQAAPDTDHSHIGSTVRPVTDDARKEVEAAHEAVLLAQRHYNDTCEALWTDPRSSRMRRSQQLAFSELSAAQFRLEQAFDAVPPRKDQE